jgi:hypothetical protein
MFARRPLYAFVAALALWAPSGNSFIHDNLDLTTAAVRFLIALALSWIGVTVLALVVEGYGKGAEPDIEELPRRRASDHSDPEDDTLVE